MVSTFAFLAAVVLSAAAMMGLWRLWRATRRVLAIDPLRDVSVSREWLMHHQSPDE
jgi:hypothetical protein